MSVQIRDIFMCAIYQGYFFHAKHQHKSSTTQKTKCSYANFSSYKTANLIRNIFRRQISYCICINDTHISTSTWKRHSGDAIPPPMMAKIFRKLYLRCRSHREKSAGSFNIRTTRLYFYQQISSAFNKHALRAKILQYSSGFLFNIRFNFRLLRKFRYAYLEQFP